MAVKVVVTAEVSYECTLTKQDEKILNNFLKKHPEYEIAEAVDKLYWSGEIELYKIYVESDFNTTSIDSVERVD